MGCDPKVIHGEPREKIAEVWEDLSQKGKEKVDYKSGNETKAELRAQPSI